MSREVTDAEKWQEFLDEMDDIGISNEKVYDFFITLGQEDKDGKDNTKNGRSCRKR